MLHVKEITNKKTWESFLARQPTYPFFQGWNWGEVQEKLGTGVLRAGLFDDNKLEAIIQLVEIKAKRGHYLYLRHGPVMNEFSEKYFDKIMQFIKKLAQEKKASFIRVSRFPKNNDASEYFRNNSFHSSAIQTVDAEVCWTLDITKSEDELLKNMRKSHRYLIKRSQTSGVKIIKTQDSKELERFLPLYKKLSVRKHFVAHKGVVEEFETFAKNDEEVLFLAIYEGRVISGALIAFVGNTAIYRHSASDDDYRNIPSSYMIQWEAIKEAKKRNKSVYNFWGIAPIGSVNHPWSGLTLFKTGFGGQYEEFLSTMDLPLRVDYVKTYAIDLVSKFRKEHKI